ncbi:MAG: Ig-like domain-containing protein [Limisphaerales bacterium]
MPTLTDATAVAAGEFHSVALRQGGTVVAWGDNREGQTMVPAGLSGVTAVAAGGSHSLALVVSGSLTPVNTLTVLANGGAQTVSLLATNISAGPADESGQTVSFTVTTVTTVTTPLNTTLFTVQPAISAAGTLTFTLAPNTIGSAVVTVTAVDNGGAPGNTSASQTFTLTVINANRAPTIAFSPTPVSVPESTTPSPYSGFATFTAGPLGEPVQTVTVVEVSNNNPTLFSAQPTLTGSGLTRDLAFVPLADANGVATVTVTVEDNGGTASGGVNHATSTFTITVTPVNNRPSITFATNNVVVLEDSGARSDSGQAIFSTGPANESGQSITNVVTENNNTGLFSVQPSVSSSGTLTFTPAPNANGFATVTLVAQDNGGTDNGGLNLSLPAIYTFTITVTAVNDVPVVTFTPANALVVAENTTPLPVSGFISFSVGPSDESPQSSTLSVVDVSNNNSSLFSAQPLVDNNGLLTFTPALNANGVATVTFTVDDGGGIANGGVNRTTTNFTITVTPVNNRPTVSLTNNSITVLEDSGARSIPGLALFTVGPANESGQSITNVTVTGYDPALFSVPPTFALNGTLTFTPAPNRFSIGTTFTVTVQDNGGTEGGGQNTSLPPVPVTYTILITPVNDAPTISFAPNVVRAEDSGAYSAGGFATFGPGPLESDTVTVVAELVSNTNPGLFSVQPAVNNAGTLTFTAAANAVGVATVTVVVEDNGGTANGGVNRATNTFTITLTPVNDAPGFLLNNGLLGNGGLRTNVTAWGYSFFGQTTLPAGMSYVTALSAGSGHDLAVRSDGSVAAWGRNTEGQTTLPPGLSGVTAVAAGGYHSLALKSDGTVVAWGFDGNGQAAVPVGLSGVTAIAAGGYHSLARKSDGTVVAWGYNGDGQAVVPGDLYVNGMTPVTVIAIAAGERHSIALRSDGTVVAWGFNGNGQASVPLTLSGVTAIAAGANHSLAVKSDGTVVAWGDNSSGQVSGALTLSGVTAVAAGESHSLALKSDGTVVAWGDNGEGQTTVPAGLVGVTAIAAGGTHNLALTRTGSGASLDTINVLTVLSGTSAQSVSLLATNISAGPADESSQTVSFTVVNGNNALFTVQPAISAAGTLTFTLAANASGSAVVTVTAVDNGGTPGVNTSAAQTFTITVVQANRAPTIAYIAPVAVSPTATNITVVESSATFSAITIATFTTGGDSGQSITTVVTSNSNSNLFSGQPIVANDGKLTFTPAPNINGVATVTVTVEDDGGTANGGVNRTTSTFTITVTPVNNLPVVTFATNNVVVLEDSGPRSVSGQAIFSTGPANESGQSITNVTATIAAPDEALFSVLPAVSLNGTLTFTPAPNANGVVTVTVVAKDNGGELLPDVNTSVAQTFTITLTPVNDAPTIAFAPANVVAAEGSTPPGATIATFTTGADSGQTISTVVTSNSRSNLFSVQPTVNTSGLLTFTPAPTSNGVATVTVTVTDSGDSANGGVNSTTSTFTITVTPVNSAPTITLATNNVVVLEDSGARTIAGLAVITTGPADESGQTITNLVTSNSRSSLFSVQPSVSANGTLTFTPAPNTNGTATLTVTAEDNGGTAGGGGNRTTSVFTITVLPVNDAPSFALRAVSTLNSVNNGSFESGDFTGWTVSDTANTTPSLAVRADPANLGLFDAGATDGTRSATHGFSGATAGTISIAQDVTVPAGGTLTFTYRASWNVSAAATANRTFRLVVQPAGGGAELFGTNLVSAAPGSFFIQPANQTVSVDLSAFGGQAVRLAFVATIPTGDTGTGSLQLDNVQLVTSSTDFVVNVNSGTSTTTTFATSIVSGPPNESEQVVSFLVTNDNNPLFSSQPAIAANGTLTFTPAPNAAGVAIVTVRARDNGGTLDGGADTSPAQTFTITVIARTGVNDAPSASFTTSLIEVMTNGAPVTLPGFATFSPGPADESAQTTTFTVANDNNGIFLAQPTITAGALTFTPSVLSSGSATVTVTTTDNGGTANGGVNVGVNTFVIRVNSARVYVDSSATVVAGGTVTVPVRLLAGGNENGLGFTLTFDPALLTLTSLSIPTSGLNTDLSLTRNDSQLASGRAGVVLFKAINTAFTAGDHLMLNATFSVLASAPAGSTPIGISSAVVNRQVTDPIGNLVTTVGYNDGSVTIIESAGATGFEGDVNGNGTVDLTDVAQIGRYVAGLDPIPSFGVGSVFQRADTAPTLGDGRVTVADYVQAQLYAAGAPLVAAGGPTLQAAAVAASRSAQSVSSPRNVRVVGGSLIAGQVNSVTVQVDAQGTEAGLGLSLTFDPTALTFVSAARGSGVPAGSLTVNSTKAAAGKLGLVLVLPAGQSLAAGTRDVITLTFNVTGSGTTAINAVANGSVAREVADVNANVLSASYAGASFNIILPAGLKAAGMERAADGSLRLVVRNTDGTPVTAAQAAKYVVHVTSNLGGAWTLLPNALVVENGSLKIVDPAANAAGLRLYKLVETP